MIDKSEVLKAIEKSLINYYNLLNLSQYTKKTDLTNYALKEDIPTVTNDLTNELKANYDTAYTHSQSTHAPTNAKANVQSDWNVTDTSSDAYIKNKPTIPTAYTHPSTHPASMITGLATVATSGSYNDLIDKPTIPSLAGYATEEYVDGEITNMGYTFEGLLGDFTSSLGNKVDKEEGKGLSTNDLTDTLKANYDAAYTHSQSAHFDGNYNNLTNKPTIPSKTSQLTNDSGYITSSSIPTSLPANGGNANTVGGYTLWTGTQAQYDAIGSKSSTTIYFIKEG